MMEQPLSLPPLRDDLQLLPASPAEDGAPNWLLFDPLSNRYFRIGEEAFGLLLVVRQWEQFSATFLHFFSWQGLALYGVTLALLKSAHELVE